MRSNREERNKDVAMDFFTVKVWKKLKEMRLEHDSELHVSQFIYFKVIKHRLIEAKDGGRWGLKEL